MMEPLCVYENRKCVNYGFEDWPLIEVIQPDGDYEKNVTHMAIMYVMEGNVGVSFGTTEDYPMTKGCFMLFPPGIKLSVAAKDGDKPKLIIIKVIKRLVLCDKYVFGNLAGRVDIASVRHTHLEANPMIRLYMELLAENVTGRLQCFRFMDIKILELFHYLRAYYRPEELARFTHPLMSPNAQFMYFVWNNYRQVRNVNQFAKLANCSLSAFKVKFKNVTGMSPSMWLTKQKAQNVFHEISTGEKSLKEISEEYHFSSVSHLGTFCRKNFGQSPGTLKPGKRGIEKQPVARRAAKNAEKKSNDL